MEGCGPQTHGQRSCRSTAWDVERGGKVHGCFLDCTRKKMDLALCAVKHQQIVAWACGSPGGDQAGGQLAREWKSHFTAQDQFLAFWLSGQSAGAGRLGAGQRSSTAGTSNGE